MIKKLDVSARKGKRYRVRVRAYDVNNKRVRKQFTASTLRELEAKIEKWKREIQQQTHITNESMAFSQQIKKWLDTTYVLEVQANTFCSVKGNVNRHIVTYFTNVDVRNVKTQDVQEFLLYKVNDTLAHTTVKKLKCILNKFFDWLVDNNIIVRNPVEKTVLKASPSKKKKETKVLEPAEISYLLNANYSSIKWQLIFFVLLLTGIRKSELLALRWEDVNYKFAELCMKARIQLVENRVEYARGLKNGDSKRMNKMPAVLVKMFSDYKHFANNSTKKEGLIFESKNQKIWDLHNFTRRFIKEIEYIGFDQKITPHDLRHAHATILIMLGVDIKTAAERMGHKDLRSLTDHYVHTTYSSRNKAVKLLDDFVVNGYNE